MNCEQEIEQCEEFGGDLWRLNQRGNWEPVPLVFSPIEDVPLKTGHELNGLLNNDIIEVCPIIEEEVDDLTISLPNDDLTINLPSGEAL